MKTSKRQKPTEAYLRKWKNGFLVLVRRELFFYFRKGGTIEPPAHKVTDDDISISICVDSESAEVIEPNETMINPEISEIAGLVYEQHYIEKLFDFPENADIRKEYELQMPNTAEIRAQFARMNSNPLLGYSEPTYDIDDYVEEIRKYIAEPINQGGNEYDFYVKKLRPNEKVWLGKYIILRPKKDEIKLSYKITSGSTDGNLSGDLIGLVGADDRSN